MTTYILPNSGTGKAHLAEERQLTGARTGRVFSTYYVARCTGHTVGGAWGYTVSETTQDAALCTRCAKLEAK